jgi:hypothetical protein
MAVIEIAKVQIRRGQELQTGIPQLDPGEFAWAEDTEHLFIGKRIVEGAVDDKNTRILTELDLLEFQTLALSTGTAASAYKYRQGVSYIDSHMISVQTKLDSMNPSLVDWGVAISTDPIDITTQLTDAITTLFQNSTADDHQRLDARRQLIIPPGNYYITRAVELPPYTSLSGSGKGITTLTLTTSSDNMFRTVDGTDGQFGGPFDFNSGQMAGGPRASKNVVLQDMTIQYLSSINPTKSLLSLDNVQDAYIKNVKFSTQANTSSYFTNPIIISTGINPILNVSNTNTVALRSVDTIATGVTASIALSNVGMLTVNTFTNTAFIGIDITTATWYITGETNSAWTGIYNQITGTYYNSLTNIVTVYTAQSWDFSSQTTGTYRLSKSNAVAGIDFRKGNYYVEHADLSDSAKLLFEVSLDVYIQNSMATTTSTIGATAGVFAVNTLTHSVYSNLNIIDFTYYLSDVNNASSSTKIAYVSSTTNPYVILLHTADAWDFTQSTWQLRDFSTNANIFVTSDAGVDFSVPSASYNLVFDPLKDTYGITSYGAGIEMRGYDNGLNSGDTSLAKNITVENCVFDGMGIGIVATGTVTYPIITGNLFNNLYHGIVFSATNFTVGPSSAIISKNRFENIVQQGIFIGPNPGSSPAYANNRSVENTFVQVGNGFNMDQNAPYIDDQTFAAAYPVITFQSNGNISTNDTFVRRAVAESETTSQLFYYNPLVTGKTTLDDGATYVLTLPSGQITNVIKIPLTGSDQMATIRYQLTNRYISRKGELLVNITADNYCSITDYYNYNQILTTVTNSVNYIPNNTVTNSFISSDPVFTTISTSTDEYYIIDNNSAQAAYIFSVVDASTSTAGTFLITTDPTAGFNFTGSITPNRYEVGVLGVPDNRFITNVNIANNYAIVQVTTSTVASTLELQVNLVVG